MRVQRENALPLLPLPAGCATGSFIRRVKRFSVEIGWNGRNIWAHCNNSGAMLGLLRKDAPVLFSPAPGVKRKLPFTLERVYIAGRNGGFWAGVNTMYPNRLLAAAWAAGKLEFACGYDSFAREVVSGSSRLDACLLGPGIPGLWVECKNVTLVEDGVAAFPDAPSLRAQKHLRELMEIVRRGERAAMFYLVQRPDAECFAPADYIDEIYARLFWEALDAGVEAYAYTAHLAPGGTDLGRRLDIKKCGRIWF